MRGSVAKKLRRIAEENTIGKPDVMYDGFRHAATRKKNRRGIGYQIKLQPGCTRHEMKRLKKEYKIRSL